MFRVLIFLAGCAVGYVLGGYVDGITGNGECPVTAGRKKTPAETASGDSQEDS